MTNQELTNVDIVLYVLYLLNGTTKKISTENIALECFRLAPSRFSWILHTKYPDIEPARKALFQARSKKNGGLVFGRHGKTKENQISDGWIFTPNGITWIEKHKSRIELLLNTKQKLLKRTRVDKQIFSLKNSNAFKKFLKDRGCENVLPYEFTDFLNASLDTPSSILRDRVAKIRAIAATAKEQEIINFINIAEKHFSKLLRI